MLGGRSWDRAQSTYTGKLAESRIVRHQVGEDENVGAHICQFGKKEIVT